MGEAFQTHLHLSRLQKYPSLSLHIHGPGNESEGSSDHLHESNSFIIIIFIIIDILEYLRDGGGVEHPLIDFARAKRRIVKIHIRIDFAIVSKKKFKIILSILEV